VMAVIRQRHAKDLVWREEFFDKLAGSNRLRQAINGGLTSALAIVPEWERQARRFSDVSRRDLLYR
jgi:hypothetical protein